METECFLISSQMATGHMENSNRYTQVGIIYYTPPSWHCHMEHGASKWGFLWAQESLVPHSRTHSDTMDLWEQRGGAGQHTKNTPCQPPSALSSASRNVLLGLAACFPAWIDTRQIWFSLDANPSEWEEGARWGCSMQITWVTSWCLPEAVQLGVQVGKAACMGGQGWAAQTDKNISEAENKSEYIGIYKHQFPTPQQL